MNRNHFLKMCVNRMGMHFVWFAVLMISLIFGGCTTTRKKIVLFDDDFLVHENDRMVKTKPKVSRKTKKEIGSYINSLRKETKEDRELANERYRVPKHRTEALKRKQTLDKRAKKISKQGR